MTTQPFISVVVPAYNEEARIARTLAHMRRYLDTQDYTYEVIVSDDGSKDTTTSIIQIIAEGWPQLRLIQAPYNQGKGAAVKRGVMQALGKYILFTDADNATPIEELDKLLPHVHAYPIVFGSRHIKGAKIHIPQAKIRHILSRLSNILIRIMAVPGIWDTQCGFKLFENRAGKNIFANVKIERFGFDIETLVIAQALGYPFKEVGISWYNDYESKVRTGRDALRTLNDLIKIRLNIIKGAYDRVGYVQTPSLPKN